MLFSLVLLFELLEIIVLTMKKLIPLFFALRLSAFGSIVVYPRSRKDLSFLKNLSNLNYLFVSFFIRFSMTILHHLMLYRLVFRRFYLSTSPFWATYHIAHRAIYHAALAVYHVAARQHITAQKAFWITTLP